jgi:putative ABC transport system ATP-binding protein
MTREGPWVLRVSDLVKVYRMGTVSTPVLHGISLQIPPGELTLIMGPSGSGKTTLISLLAGVLRPTSGSVELCGSRISDMTEGEVARVRRDRVGFVFQSYNLFPALTAQENVAVAIQMTGHSWKAAKVQAAGALQAVGLGERLLHRPADLSGGEKQRVAIARALVTRPTLVVGDEVTAALDGVTAFQVLDLLRAHVTDRTAVILVTHDRRLERFAERVIEIEDGRLLADRRGERALSAGQAEGGA